LNGRSRSKRYADIPQLNSSDRLLGAYRWLSDAAHVFLWKPRFVIAALAIPALTAFVCFRLPQTIGSVEAGARWASGVLEILGSLVVLVGILGRRRLFGLASSGEAIANWMDEASQLFTARRAPQKLYLDSAGAVLASGVVRGSPIVVQQSDAERIEMLKSQVASLEKRLHEHEQTLSREIERLEHNLSASASAGAQRVSLLESQTRELSVGSIQPEVMGLAWLICGLIFSAWPNLTAVVALAA
jgi:hypothetical protein